MMNNLSNLKNYKFKKEDQLLIDANVWMAIYGPIAYQDWRTKIYSQVLRDIRTYGSRIYIDILVLSEFINAFSRYTYNCLPDDESKPRSFKEYRDSEDFKQVAEEIAISVKKILRITKRCETTFLSVDLEKALKQFEKKAFDYNDYMLCDLCKSKGLTLITHDADFSYEDINILTANEKLITC